MSDRSSTSNFCLDYGNILLTKENDSYSDTCGVESEMVVESEHLQSLDVMDAIDSLISKLKEYETLGVNENLKLCKLMKIVGPRFVYKSISQDVKAVSGLYSNINELQQLNATLSKS